jgi:hypothetical protein
LKEDFPAEVGFMAKDKDDKDPFSDSGELFESIFRDAITADETKKGKKGRADSPRPKEKAPPLDLPPATEQPSREPSTQPGPFEKSKKAGKPKKPPKPPKTPKPPKLPKGIKTKSPKNRKGSGSRKSLLLLFLLLVLGAGLFFYGDSLGLGRVVDTVAGTVSSLKQKILGPDETQVASNRRKAGPVKKRTTVSEPQKPAAPKPGTKEEPPAPLKKAKAETPQTSKAATPGVEGKKTGPVPKTKKVSDKTGKSGPVPGAAPQPAKATPKETESKKAPPVPKAEKTPDVAVKTATRDRVPQKAVSQTPAEKKTTQPDSERKIPQTASLPKPQRTAKATAPDKAVQKRQAYPYSVYLGAYKTLDRAQRAVAMHQGQGLSPYWVKVDLGSKGVWYRVFEGHFDSQKAAESFVRKRKLEQAKVKKTRYTNLIGIYSTAEDLRDRSFALLKRGYCPYAIPEGNGHIGLYAGAFYTKAGAETQHRALVAQGIQNKVVRR